MNGCYGNIPVGKYTSPMDAMAKWIILISLISISFLCQYMPIHSIHVPSAQQRMTTSSYCRHDASRASSVDGAFALQKFFFNYSDYSRTSGLLSRSKSFVIHPKQEKGCWRCALSQDFTESNSIGLPPKEKFLWETPKANFIQYFENMPKSTFSNGDMLFRGSSSGPISASHFAKSVSQHL